MKHEDPHFRLDLNVSREFRDLREFVPFPRRFLEGVRRNILRNLRSRMNSETLSRRMATVFAYESDQRPR